MWARKQEGPFSLDRMLEGIEPVRATNAKKECCVKSLLVVSEVSVLEISGDSRGVKRRDHGHLVIDKVGGSCRVAAWQIRSLVLTGLTRSSSRSLSRSHSSGPAVIAETSPFETSQPDPGLPIEQDYSWQSTPELVFLY